MDVESMTVKELKQELKSRGLKVNGLKAELKERLITAVQAEQAIDTDTNQHDVTIADFEEYINDEYQRMQENENVDDTDNHNNTADDVVNDEIHHLIESNNASIQQQEEEKDLLLQTDFDLNPVPSSNSSNINTTTPQIPQSQPIISDFAETEITSNTLNTSDDPKALNNADKVKGRMHRFGTLPLTADAEKLESRKRRFAATTDDTDTTNNESQPAKKQRIDPQIEQQKIFERAQKFGTDLPKNFKMTKEQSELINADKIARAKRFGTEHLLPSEILSAQKNAKKAERMKRFNTNEHGKIIIDGEQNEDVKKEQKAKNIIKAGNEKDGSTKLMERKLRFGTLSDDDKQKQRQQRFGGNQGKQMNMNKGGKVQQKKFSQRQVRNNQKLQKFRQFKKSQRGRGGYNYGGNRGGFGGRGRGRGRGFGRGGNNNGGFRGGYNRNFRGYNKQRQQQQRFGSVQMNAEEQQRRNERKMRFTASADI